MRRAAILVSVIAVLIGLLVTESAATASPSHADGLAVTYQTPNCNSGYFADLDAQQYLNLSAADYSWCPVRAMFVNARGYFPTWAYETNVANDYGWVMAYSGGGCTDAPDTGPYFDFQLPCKAHDYCYDLRRAGFSGTVTDDSCDYAFFLLMAAHCDDRVLSGACMDTAWAYYGAVLPFNVTVSPASVRLFAVHSSKCANVANASSADGEWIVQYPCSGGNNERFRMIPAPGFGGWFQIQAVHSGKCVDVGADNKLRQYSCATSAQRRFRIQGSYLQDTYTLRSGVHNGAWCWDVPGSTLGVVQLVEWPCNETNNERWVMV